MRSVPSRLFLLLSLLCAGFIARAQQDSVMTSDWRLRHKPAKAALFSALVPGAGQIYNHKYWKAPIVWAGLGTCIYFVQRNTREYERYRDNYIALVDGDPTTVDEFNGRYSADNLRSVADTYHKWRDLSWIACGLVYILNVVDASVDGHFVRFDVNPDLTLELQPALPMAAQGAVGLSLGARF